jgi:hypothetical protein
MRTSWQLLAAAAWGSFAIFLFVRDSVVPPGRFDGPVWDRAACVSLGLCAWNLVRWYLTRNSGRDDVIDASPLKPRRTDDPPPYEYNAALDFQKMDRESGMK